jgi:hypothetical protein
MIRLAFTASDDQSTQDATMYAAAIRARGQPTLVSAVHAAPSERLTQFMNHFTYRWSTPLDAYNMEAISIFAQLFPPLTFDGCLPVAAIDTDDRRAGLQLDCALVTSHEGTLQPLPMCTGSAFTATSPCWQPIEDPSCSSGVGLLLGGGYRVYHPRIEGRCAIE